MSGELPASPPYLNHTEGDEATNPENHLQTHEGQEGDND